MADANVDIILFDNPNHFSPEEKKYCREIGNEIFKVLTEHGILDRCFWVSEESPSGRVIKLVVKPGTIFQLPATEIPDVPQSEILTRINKGITDLKKQE